MRSLRIGLAQINSTVGDIEGNALKVLDYIERARGQDVDLVVFPKLALTGYPPEDLLLKPHFVAENQRKLMELVPATAGLTAVVGFVDSDSDIYNAAAVMHDGRLSGVYRKCYLPNYGVFDENRYFQAGSDSPVFLRDGITLGVNICEDIWHSSGPTSLQAQAGTEIVVNIDASPYYMGKWSFREKMLATRAADQMIIIVYINMVGGQDELVFDGTSAIFNEKGELVARGKQFEEDLIVADLDIDSVFRYRLRDTRQRQEARQGGARRSKVPHIKLRPIAEAPAKPPLTWKMSALLEGAAEVYAALVTGTRDYVRKNGFSKVLIGLSGGVDSALVAVIAADALGPSQVVGIFMPSRYTSESSRVDAHALAENLSIELMTIPIEEVFQSYLTTLTGPFHDTSPGVAEENIQARIRGNMLMALSNKFGWLVLTTGNKSEMATGYATLYGDMAGGFAAIKDVPKTLVYDVAQYRNQQAGKPVIPQNVLDKEPTAELRPDQRDADSLPPYPMLDPILKAYVEEDKSLAQIVAMGFPENIVKRVITLVDRSEYKRRQAPPGVKITPRAFGRDRRLPLTNRFIGSAAAK
ncbi:NAD+ synthase [Chloroflexota bacterium]